MTVSLAQQGRIWIGRLPFDKVDMAGALASIEEMIATRAGGMVFTPNVDHVVMGEHDDRFRSAYHRASLCLVDGTPVLWASRLIRQPLPEKVSGSDMVLPLMQRASQRRWRVFLLGGAPGVGDSAAARLRTMFPELDIVGIAAPRIDLGGALAERRAVAAQVAAARPDLVLVAFGAPKQELFCDEVMDVLKPAVLVCVGAGVDFVAGVAKRSPAWMSRWGVEWLYRLAHEPRRLAGRYLLRDPEFALIVLKQIGRSCLKSCNLRS
jgi:N-acetylglucosaminyldiphosphoundecaprenol N-acetyl-beta-D-mannosaminyltransferase